MECRHQYSVLKLASFKSIKTAALFFCHYFKYYGQNIFSRTTVLYLIVKVERKSILYLKHEIIFYQKEKRSRIFQVKTISKDVRKTIFSSIMFLFNSFEVCHSFCKKIKTIHFSPLNQGNKK